MNKNRYLIRYNTITFCKLKILIEDNKVFKKLILVLFLIISPFSFTFSQLNPAGPMPTTTWHQDIPWSNKSPSCYGSKLPSGCGALAVSQLLYYFQYPQIPLDINEWYYVFCHDSPFPSQNPFRNFNVSDYSLDFGNYSQLIFDVGRAINTKYVDGTFAPKILTGSTALSDIYKIRESLEEVFKFHNNILIASMESNSITAIKQEIYQNLDLCQPVLLYGKDPIKKSRHFMVIDDYDSAGNFHVNFGQGGSINPTQEFFDPFQNNSYNKWNSDMKIMYNIFPKNYISGCDYFNSNTIIYPLKGEENTTYKKSNSCPTLLYPSQSIISNEIYVDWLPTNNAVNYKVTIQDISTNTTLFSEETYLGISFFHKEEFFPTNRSIGIKINPIDISGVEISCPQQIIVTSDNTCQLDLTYVNKYCIGNGTQYVIEVEFTGENTVYDLYADWAGTTYDSKDDITPGFYILGPFPINQNVGIIVEDITNPFNCFDTELVIAPPNPSNCVPNPISQNNGGSSQNPPVTCSVPSFNRSINGTVVTYSWLWPTNAQNIIIEKSLDQNIVFDSYVIPNNGTTSIAVSYAPCEAFYVRARVDCGQNFSNYTNYLNVDLSDISCNTPSCPFPTNVNHNIITSSNPDQLNVSWSNDGNSHEICFYENGTQISCSVKPSNQTSTGIYIDDCENYDYKIRSVCGSDYSNWYNNNESIQTGNNCNALTDIRISSFGYIDIKPTHVNIENLEIRNDGNYAVSNVKIELYLESASFSGPPIYVTEVTYAFLANETKNISPFGSNIQSLIPPNAFTDAVECNYLLVLDADGSVPERNESNNTSLYIHQDIFFGCSDSNAYPGNYHASTNIEVCYYCNDGIKNGTESGVDCGGAFCPPCCNNIYYLDNDGDGFGNDTQSTIACTAPSGYVSNGIDCNDNNANIYPGNVESCDGIDNDCNTLIDECCTTYYIDNDEDGYGGNTTIQSCYQLFNYVTNNNDCDDNNANINPGASEICDSLDNNCTGGVDEGSVCTQPGDYCTSAIQISNNNNYQFINSNGPNSGNGALNIDPGTASPELEHSDWYYFTPTEDGLVHLISCYYGIDTRVHIYSGDCNTLNYITTFDDECELYTGGNEFASSGSLYVTCGTTYYFEWDDNWSESPFTFEFSFLPFNDLAPIISSTFFIDFENTTNALLQSNCADDFNWVQHTGMTSTRVGGYQTGPVSAFEGDNYYYIESSSPNNPNKSAIFYTPFFNLSYFNIPIFSFQRHMYGSNIGELTVEISDDYGVSWNQINTWIGNFGDQWHSFEYYLTTNGNNDYANKVVQFRITGITGSGFEGDIAIDNIVLYETCLTVTDINFDLTSNFSYWEAADLVKSNSTVTSNATTTFDSGNRIELNPGFEVQQGATFLAKIDGCDTNLNSSIPDIDSEKR